MRLININLKSFTQTSEYVCFEWDPEPTFANASRHPIGWYALIGSRLDLSARVMSHGWAGQREPRFSWLFRPFQLIVTTIILFNQDNMATTASRYYSEDGRATKRQKTDGMATVSWFSCAWLQICFTYITVPLSVFVGRRWFIQMSVGEGKKKCVTTRRRSSNVGSRAEVSPF